MNHKIAIAAAGVAVLGVSLALGSTALAAASSPVPGKASAQGLAARAATGTLTAAPSYHGPLIEPMAAYPSALAAGGSVLVKGGDCSPGTSVFLSLGPADKPLELATVTADAHGVFTGTVHIPADTPTGPNTLWAACKAPNPTGKLLHTATLKITG